MEIEEQKVQINQEYYMENVKKNWANQQTWAFIESLTFNGYILAGNSIANMIAGIPLQGDLDFWVQDQDNYMLVLDQISVHYQNFSVYPSMIQMTNKSGNLPRINLIFTSLTPNMTISRFDLDYCRCYWTPTQGIHLAEGCKRSIMTKIIRQPSIVQNMMTKRILKALKYGYIFMDNFWQNFSYLLKNRKLIVNSEEWIQNPMPHIVKIEDFKLSQFKLEDIYLKVTDVHDIQLTLKELSSQYQALAEMENVKLPVLLNLKRDQNLDVLHQYVQSIVLQNPLRDTHYMQVKIGTNFVYCGRRRRGARGARGRNNNGRRFSSQSSSQTSSQSQKSQKMAWEQQEQEVQYHYQQQDQQQQQQQQNQEQQQQSKSPKFISLSSQLTKKILHFDKNTRLIKLNQDGSSYVRIDYLPENMEQLAIDTFYQMYALHPQNRHKIIMYEKEVEVSRFSRSYLYTSTNLDHTKTRSYMYSGFDTSSNNSQLPKQFAPFYQYINLAYPTQNFNQVIANWYENENDYIAPHSDCQRGMTEEKKVAILSLYPNKDQSNTRTLQIVSKGHKDALAHKFVISLDNGTIVTMGGKTQDQFVHGIAKQKKKCSQRISLSFRQMVQ